ncbi:MAG: glycosyltransferase family 87 protein [Bacteroidota bacterium]
MKIRNLFILFSAGLFSLVAAIFYPAGLADKIWLQGGHIDGYTMYKAMEMSVKAPGKDIYNYEALLAYQSADSSSKQMRVSPYLYPPQASFFMKPLLFFGSPLRFMAALLFTDWIMRLFIVALMCLLLLKQSAFQTGSAYTKQAFWPFLAVALLSLSMFTTPAKNTVINVQVSGIIAGLLFAALFAANTGKSIWARGLLLAAGFLKVYPLIFGLFILKPRLKSYLFLLFNGTVLSLLIWASGLFSATEAISYLSPKTPYTQGYVKWLTGFELNCSIWQDLHSFNESGSAFGIIASVLYGGTILLIAGTFLYMAARQYFKSQDPSNRLLFAIACISITLSFWPIVWINHFFIILPFVCLAVADTKFPLVFRIACIVYVLIFFSGIIERSQVTRLICRYSWANDANTILALVALITMFRPKLLRHKPAGPAA